MCQYKGAINNRYTKYFWTQTVCFITCTHTDCARRTTAPWAHVSRRRSSSAAHRSETYSNIISLFPTLILYTEAGICVCVCVCAYFHGECVCERRNTLQGLISTAATTSPHRHTGWDEEMVRLRRQLPPNLHQSVPRLTGAARINLQPPAHWWR